MVAMSATLSKRIRDDVLSKVQFKQMTSGYITVDVGNDQQNVVSDNTASYGFVCGPGLRHSQGCETSK